MYQKAEKKNKSQEQALQRRAKIHVYGKPNYVNMLPARRYEEFY